MKIELKDLYQLLIAECRYGYTRNNHLMPDGAYEHIKKYLPIMIEEDKELTLITAKQLCDECISMQITDNFYEGIDDEFDSRQKSFEFVEWLLEFIHNVEGEKWVPYNFDLYIRNKKLDDELLYNIYEDNWSHGYDGTDEWVETGPQGNPVNKEKLSKNNVVDYLFIDILDAYEGIYRKWAVDKYTTKYVFDDLKRVFYIRKEN